MIHVVQADPPGDFAEKIGNPGQIVLNELQGVGPKRRGPRRKNLDASIWTRALPDLQRLYHRRCAYTALYINPGCRDSVDHFVPSSKDQTLAYTWSNFRYAVLDANRIKNDDATLDPFSVRDDWFSLNFSDYKVELTANFPAIHSNLWSVTNKVVNDVMFRDARKWYHDQYLGVVQDPEEPSEPMTFRMLEYRAPFVARELRRQGRLRPEDQR
jgi:hypothetical protein